MVGPRNRIECKYVLNARNIGTNLLNLCMQFGTAYKNIFHGSVPKNKFYFMIARGRVNRNEYRPQFLHSQIRDQPFGPVIGNDGNFILLINGEVISRNAYISQSG